MIDAAQSQSAGCSAARRACRQSALAMPSLLSVLTTERLPRLRRHDKKRQSAVLKTGEMRFVLPFKSRRQGGGFGWVFAPSAGLEKPAPVSVE